MEYLRAVLAIGVLFVLTSLLCMTFNTVGSASPLSLMFLFPAAIMGVLVAADRL